MGEETFLGTILVLAVCAVFALIAYPAIQNTASTLPLSKLSDAPIPVDLVTVTVHDSTRLDSF
ncbi:MAG: hypothetical protein ACREA3_01035 [Nitrosotalea sp.]